MDDGDAYLKTQTYSKGEVYNRTEIDQLTMGDGGGSPVIVEDNLMSVSTTNALSSNQGRILDETKADINHTHPEYLTDVPAEYLTQSEGDLRYQASGNYLTDIPADYLTETEGNFLYQPKGTYLTDVPAEYLTQTEGDSVIPTKRIIFDRCSCRIFDRSEGDLRYQASGTIPAHDHAIADVTGLQTALDGKSDVNHIHDEYALVDHTHPEYLTAVPLEYLTATEGDALYQAIGTIPEHTHPEYLTDIPADYLTETEGDLRYQSAGNYLTAVPPEYLTDVEGDLRYQPKGTYLTDIPAEYLTQSEGDTLYQPIGSIPDHAHADYLTLVEGDARYQPAGTYLTDIPADYLTQTEGDGLYQPKGTYLTDVPAEYLTQSEGDTLYQPKGTYLTDIPAEYLTDAEGDTKYQAINTVPTYTHTTAQITDFPTEMTPKLASGLQRGGARIGNGLAMSGEYMTVKSGAGLVTSGTTYQVEINRATTNSWYTKNATGQSLTMWKGTQAEYDVLTPDANTLYFIVG